jgi:hypothetical protein
MFNGKVNRRTCVLRFFHAGVKFGVVCEVRDRIVPKIFSFSLDKAVNLVKNLHETSY